MPVPITFAVGQLQVGYCWSSPQQFAQDLFGPAGIISGTIPGGGFPVLVQANAPGPQFQGNTLWGKLVGGQLEGIYLYSGGWYRSHPVPPASSSRIIWMNTEAALWAYDGGDGTNPATSPPTLTTGAMWQRDTTFGADDGSIPFRFPVGVGQNSTAYNLGAATVLTQGSTGGEEKHVLTTTESVYHTHGLNEDMATLNAGTDWGYVGTTHANQAVVGAPFGGDPAQGNAAAAHQNMPPYVAVFFAKRTVRQMIAG